MKKQVRFLFVLALLGTVVSLRANAKHVRELLLPNGTVNLKTGFSGTLDVSGFRMVLDPRQGPVFVNTLLNSSLLPSNQKSRQGYMPVDTPLPNAWNAVDQGLSGAVQALAVIGTDLYVGGSFTAVGGDAPAVAGLNNIAKWNGSTWSALDKGLNNAVQTLAVIGTDLYTGGTFTAVGTGGTTVTGLNRVAKWNGSAWSALGTGLNNQIKNIAVMGNNLYVGGLFTDVGSGGTSVTGLNRVAKWDGTAWSAMDKGLGTTTIYVLAVMGTDVYVGGSFTAVGSGGTTVAGLNRIAKWNGSAWSALDMGLNGTVESLLVVGTDLYVGGMFTDVGTGGTSVAGLNNIAKWNGSAWSALDKGLNYVARTLTMIGTDLYVGGFFTAVGTGGTGVSGLSAIAKWDGSSWSAFDKGVNSQVYAIAEIGTNLYIGGNFTDIGVGGTSVPGLNYIAQWTPCSLTVSITADPSLTIASGSGTTLTASGATSYTWSTGETTAAISASAAGTYSVTGATGTCSATASTEVSVTTAIPGAALNFDGTNDYVSIPTLQALNGSSLFTYEAWIKTTSRDNYPILFSQGPNTYLLIESPNNITFRWFDASSGGATTTGAPLSADNVWKHIAVVFDGSQVGDNNRLKIYVDGELQTLNFGGSVPSSLVTTTSAFLLGSINNGALPFSGTMDEARIWSRALTQCEIQNTMHCELSSGQTGLQAYYKFNQGVADADNASVTSLIDDSGNSNTGALTNFNLTGPASNWVAQGGVTTGITCSTTSNQITITPSPSLTIALGSSATLTASGATSYTWNTGETTAAISASVAGTYSVTGATGTCSTTASAVVSVTTAADPCAFVPQNITVTGFSDNYPFNGVYLPNGSFNNAPKWINQAQTAAILWTGSDWQIRVNLDYVDARATNSTGSINNMPCTGWVPRSDAVGNPVLAGGCGTIGSGGPTVTIAATPSLTLTSGSSATLTASGATSYIWSTGEITAAISASVAGTYSVTGVTGACSATASAEVSVTAAPSSITWTSQTSAADNGWQSAVYGNGVFVAIANSGSGNRVMTSPDGITWTSQTSAADNQWAGVTYGNGLFVAVAGTGSNNRVMTSPDGITWTSQTSAANNDWRLVTYGAGLFVAVSDDGDGNRVMTSPDGITWTSQASAADNSWQSITYANGLFVAVANSGNGNRVMTSPDGITWTSQTSAANNDWNSVVYGSGLFVAVADDGVGNGVMTSPDGITWTSRTPATDNEWQSVTYGLVDGNPMFEAVAFDGPVMGSPDGITWTSQTSAATNQWLGVTYANGIFVAVSRTGDGNRVMTLGTAVCTPPTVSIASAPSLTIASGNSTTLTASGASSYIWSTGETTEAISASIAGTYSVTGITGTCSATASAEVSVTTCTPPTVIITGSPSLTVIQGNSLTLTASGADSYTWNTGAKTASIVVSPVYNSYFIATGATQAGCSSTTLVFVNVLACTSTLTASATSVCVGNALSLTATGTVSVVEDNDAPAIGGAPKNNPVPTTIYTWLAPDGATLSSPANTSVVSASFTTSGVKTFTVTISSPEGCVSTATVSVTALDYPTAPILTVSSDVATTGTPLSISANGCAGTLNWQVAGGSGTASGSIYVLTAAGSYTLTATCSNGTCEGVSSLPVSVTVAPSVGGPLTLIAPVYDCASGAITFRTTGGDGTPIQYFAIGITPWTSSPNQHVEPGLRNDPSSITLHAKQGNREVTYLFDLVAACQSPVANRPPVVSSTIASQTITVGQIYSFPLTNTFTDPDAQVLTLTVSGLPTGLSFNGTTISGTPSVSGVSNVTAVATDPGSLSVSTSFAITVIPASLTVTPPPPPTALALIAPLYDCNTGAITFRTTGGDGSPIQYFAIGITSWSSSPNQQVEAGLRGDPSPVTLHAKQGNTEVTYVFDLKNACNPVVGNNPPVVSSPIASQTAMVGQAFSFAIPTSTFTDPEGQVLTLRASGLPAGLSFTGTTITGTPSASGVSTVTVTATDPGSLSVSTSFALTIFPASVTIVNPPTGGPLTLIAPVYDCSSGAITFRTTGGDGSLIEYFAIGITPWTSSPNQHVESGLRNDPSAITLHARQGNTEVTYLFDLASACQTTVTNHPPIVSNPIPGQTAAVGLSYSFAIPVNTFTDPDVQALTLTATDLPAGLSFNGTSITGTPSVTGVSTVVITATDPGSLSISAAFSLSVVPAPILPPTTPLVMVAPTYDCSTGAITFNTTGGDGTPIQYFAIGITPWTSSPNQQVEAGLRGDPSPVTLHAKQSGIEVTYVFDLKNACASPRLMAEPTEPLSIKVLGNPVTADRLDVEIRGALGESLYLQLVGEQGQPVDELRLEKATSVEQLEFEFSRPAGLYFLKVSTPTQQRVVKVIKQ